MSIPDTTLFLCDKRENDQTVTAPDAPRSMQMPWQEMASWGATPHQEGPCHLQVALHLGDNENLLSCVKLVDSGTS